MSAKALVQQLGAGEGDVFGKDVLGAAKGATLRVGNDVGLAVVGAIDGTIPPEVGVRAKCNCCCRCRRRSKTPCRQGHWCFSYVILPCANSWAKCFDAT